MRKAPYIKQAAEKNPETTQALILEVLLDIRQMLEKQNEMLRRGISVKSKERNNK